MANEPHPSSTDKRDSGLTMGNIDGGLHDSIIAGRDVKNANLIKTGDIKGSYNAIGQGAKVMVTHIHQAHSAIEELDKEAQLARRHLAGAIVHKVEGYLNLIASADATDGLTGPKRLNPYKALLDYKLEDAPFFYGREEAIRTLLERIHQSRLTILHAESGTGKSSLLQAGLAARLLAAGHLPLVLRPHDQLPATVIKKAFLPDIETLPELDRLNQMSLLGFLTEASLIIQPGTLYLFLDQFEQIFVSLPVAEQKNFAAELADCLNEPSLNIRWIFSVRKEHFSNLSILRPHIPTPFENDYFLQNFSQAEAAEVITQPTLRQGVQYEDGLVDTILSDLNQGSRALNPAQVQLVCYTLFEEVQRTSNRQLITKHLYQGTRRRGAPGAKGILSGYLKRVLNETMQPGEREHAWQLLTIIAKQGNGKATTDKLVAQMKLYGVKKADSLRLLALLHTNRLLRLSNHTYELTSTSLLPHIRQWASKQAVLEQSRVEVKRQLERIRGSALRGIFGGALGFSLAFLLTYWSQTGDESLLGYITAFRAVPGAITGLLLILFVDISLASYHGPKRYLRWLVSGLAGAGAFAFALLFHAVLRSVSDLLPLVLITIEGAAWGFMAGIGAVWVMGRQRWLWSSYVGVGLACGLTLGLFDQIGHAFQEASPSLVVLAGALMPLIVLVTARMARD